MAPPIRNGKFAVVVLIGVLVPHCHSRRTPSSNSLFAMRQVIDEYTYDKQKIPASLPDLVSAGYLDPKRPGWAGQNVFDVFKKTQEKAADGTPNSEW